MNFAYVDESGNVGPTSTGGSKTYTLACVLVEAVNWPDAFDGLIAFRRSLRSTFALPVRAEVKANHLIRGSGIFRTLGLNEAERRAIYRLHMRVQEKLGLRVFAVVVEKDRVAAQGGVDPRELAWETLLQRLEVHTRRTSTPALVVHDEGEDAVVRKLVRKARRAGSAGSRFGTGQLSRPARLLLDDPVPRNSGQSYFIQLADLDAYAAYRKLHPPPNGRLSIVPPSMWDNLGSARHEQANMYSGGPPGIVTRG